MTTKTPGDTGEVRKPDSQGRISIGKEYVNKTYSLERRTNGDIILRPVMMIHEREAWLLANEKARQSVERGIADAEAGRTHDLGSFAEFLNDEDDDEEEGEE